MNGVSPKVANGAAAGGITAQLSVIIVWSLGQKWQIPPEVAVAFAGVAIPIISGLVGWLTPHDPATTAAIAATTAAITTQDADAHV